MKNSKETRVDISRFCPICGSQLKLTQRYFHRYNTVTGKEERTKDTCEAKCHKLFCNFNRADYHFIDDGNNIIYGYNRRL